MDRNRVISQLQSVGEGALGKIAHSPATRTAYQGARQVRDRGERLMHTIESIEARLTAIERRLAAIEPTKPATRASAGERAARKPPTAGDRANTSS
jgi:hypothetical protein